MLFDGSNFKNDLEYTPDDYSSGAKSETAVSLFQKNSTLYPDRIAVSFEEKTISYFKLYEQASQFAMLLQEHKIKKGDVVAVKMERSIDLIITIMGIIKSGAAFVCIDPGYPESRIRYMIQNSGAKCLVADDAFSEPSCTCLNFPDLLFKTPVNFSSPELKPEDLSYVVFTSGTTGNPKGSMITHAGLVNMIRHHQKLFSATHEDAVLQFASISFDASVFEIFLAMLTGATLVLIRKETIYDKEQFLDYLKAQRVTITLLPPVFLSSLNRAELKPLRVLITGGEACNLEDALYYSRQLRFFNAYGPSEASVIVSIHEVKEENAYEKYIPIGAPIENIFFHVLNDELKPVAKGETGDLYVSGVGLATGYINNEELTTRAFIKSNNLTLYKTGDLVRETEKGEFVILGRKDSQVKILGHRIELSGIESVMNSLESVSNSLVTAHEDARGGKFLCGYYLAEKEISAVEMRSILLQHLPVFMIPQHLIQVKEFVLNQSGKVDKTKLPKPEAQQTTGEDFVSEPEMSLASIWKQVLDLKEITSSEHFFTAGGHSLKAAELVTRIYKTFHIKLKVGDVYDAPVFSELADLIRKSTGSVYQALKPAAAQKYYPLSSAQRRMYLMNISGKQDISYNVSVVLEFASGISVEVVRAAVNELVRRHEILRTRYVIEGEDVVQEVMEDCTPEIELETVLKNEVSERARIFVRPFDLGTAPVLRVGYFHVQEGGCAIVFDSHHIAVDGTSVGILVKEFIALIQNDPISTPLLHYKDYAAWENQHYGPDYFSEHENFWLSMFDKLPTFSIPVDIEAGRNKQFSGSRIIHRFDDALVKSIYAFLQEHNVSLFQFFLTNYYLFLSRYTAKNDVVIGTAVANRNMEEVQNMPGMFVNTLAMRMKLQEEWNFAQLLKEVQQVLLNCFHYQEYPFEKLIERLGLVGNNNKVPLIDTTIVVQNLDFFTKEFSEDLTCKYENYADTSKFAISVFIIENAGSFTMQLDYNTHVFRKETIDFLVQSFGRIIENSVTNPSVPLSEISLIDDQQMTAMRKIIAGEINTEDVEFDF